MAAIQIAKLRVYVSAWFRRMDGYGHKSVNQDFWKGTASNFLIPGLGILDPGKCDEPQTPGEGTRPTTILASAKGRRRAEGGAADRFIPKYVGR